MKFPTDPRGEDAFAYAFYLFLRALPNLDVTVDGWKTLQIVRETDDFLQAVGIMYVLPNGEPPFEVVLRRRPNETLYWLRVGVDDDRWNSLSEAKRWKLVYYYAQGQRNEEWEWSEPISGSISDD